MAKFKLLRSMAFRAAGVATALALLSLALVASPAAATMRNTTTTVTVTTPAFTGEPIVFTATITAGSGMRTPTGSVTFDITGTDASTPFCDGGNTSASNTISLTGNSAQCSIPAGLFADASPYSVSAVYSGDSNFTTSTGTIVGGAVISKGRTTTTLTSATNPTVTGQPVSFTAVVSPNSPSTGVPTGNVTFSITGTGDTSIPCDAGDTQMLDGSDMATCSVGAGLLAANSTYAVTAFYGGDHNYAHSTGTLTQTVDRATATISLASSASSSYPFLLSGQPVSFTATVTGIVPPGAGTPTGSIVFTVVGSDGTVETCQGGDTVPLSGLNAVCNFPKGVPATSLTYTVTATLSDPNFKTPGGASLVQPVNRAASDVVLSGVPSRLVFSEGFSFNVAVQTVAPGTGAPTGLLEWAVCPTGQPSCTPQTGTLGGNFNLPNPTKQDIRKSENKVTITIPQGLHPGFYEVQATYLGDPNQAANSSSIGHIDVSQVPSTMQLALSRNPANQGSSMRIRAAIQAYSTSASNVLGAPSGTVTYTITGASGDQLTCTTGTDNVITISTDLKNQGVGKCAIAKGQLMTSDSPYKIKAVYSGDSNYYGAKSTASVTVETPSG
jgi:large repetitive protein